MSNGVDPKVMARVQKLLNLARDGGATEHEAALALERAQGIMSEYGLSIATIEASGGEGEAREKREARGRAGKQWMIDIMEALAKASYVHASYLPGSRDFNYSDEGPEWKVRPARWTLIGRQSAVMQVQLMHEYLVKTVDRVARERGTPTDERFKAGMGERLVERVTERHEAALAERRRQEAEQRARAQHPAAATSNAMVVVMDDFEQKERDLNNDLRRGKPPGTTARDREKEQAEERERIAKREARKAELAERGFSDDEIFYILIGYGEDEARKMAKPKPKKEETEAQRKRREQRDERHTEEFWERFQRRRARENERKSHPSYRAGQAAGERVGLDTQVGRGSEVRKLK